MKGKMKMKRWLASVLSFALVLGSGLIAAPSAEAAAKPKKLTVTPKKKTLYVGNKAKSTTKIKVKVSPKKANKKVTFKSSNKKVATVNSKGKVTAKKVGKATITVTAKGNKKLKKKVKITVKKYRQPAGDNPANTGTSGTTTATDTPSSDGPDGSPTPSRAPSTATATPAPAATPTPVPTPTPEPPLNPESVKLNVSSRTLNLRGDIAASTTKLTATLTPENTINKELTWASSDESIATVGSDGTVSAHKLGKTTITVSTANGKQASCVVTVSPGTVSVHDPSVVKGTDGFYYIYGSHTAFAKTDNFMGWTTVTNNISKKKTDTTSIFKDYWNNWAKYNNKGVANKQNPTKDFPDGEDTDLSGNQWAPDVIWNEKMNKWCMYMSVNGPDCNSVIVLCTADTLDGDWEVKGPVVYSGFTSRSGVEKHDFTLTDYTKATGETTLNTRYGNGTWNTNYGTNAIDPCVKYDEEGNLWMSYGSWFGGIYFLKLDSNTGLRDYTCKYELDMDTSDGFASDPYMGIRVAGGNRTSGEASYIIEKDGYYYMFLSYGALDRAGGYNMRVFRSENITGPYVDKSGVNALRGGNTVGNIGIRLMAGYKWSCNDVGYLAQGHNSALVDDDGKMYLVYHSRFDNGDEYHRVETHQMFMSEDGWLCVAPYEYNGEEISETGYEKSDLTGTYEYLVQNPAQKNGTCAQSTYITLGGDGSMGGLDNADSWEIKDGKPYVTFTIGGVKYQGVFSYGYEESANRKKVMTFSAVGENNICIWGSKTLKEVKTDQESQDTDKEALTISATATEDFYLPTVGAYNSVITWTTADENVIRLEGRKAVINRRLTDTQTTLTATITKGSSEPVTKEFTVAVKKYDVSLPTTISTDSIDLPDTAGGTTEITWASDKADIINPATGEVKKVINDTTVTLTATIKLQGDEDVVKTFEVMVKGITINVASIVRTNSISLPSEAEGYTISWESSDRSVINVATGEVSRDETEVKKITLTATISKGQETDTREIIVTVQPVQITDFLYRQDYENVGAVTEVFSSISLAGGMAIATEGDNKFFQLTQDGSSGNRGAVSADFTGASEVEDYVVELDLAIRSGNVADRSQSQFVLTGLDTVAFSSSNINNGLTQNDNYILKLSTGPSSTEWTLNDTDKKVTIPANTWVHVTAVVSTESKTVSVIISKDRDTLCDYNVPLKGNGFLKGIYILSGRGNGLTKIDNIQVY